MARRLLTVLLLAGLAFTCLDTNAQTPHQSAPSLGLEVIFYSKQGPAYLAVRPSRSGAWFARFERVADWKQPADTLPVNAVNIACEAAESGVRLWVSVYLGTKHEQEKPVTSYILHEGEKITVRELSEVGVVPFEIKVIRLSGLIGSPPAFVTKAKSIELVVMEPNLASLPSYKVAVRNLSNKSVRALRVTTLQGDRRQISSMPQGKDGLPLIGPQGVYEFEARLAVRSTQAGDSYTPFVLANQIVEVSSAIFEDGSFEGDSDAAIALTFFRKGRKIQLARVTALLERTLTPTDSDAFMNLDWLRTQIGSLGIEANPAAVDDVASQLAGIPGNNPDRVKTGIEVALSGVRSEILKEITQFRIRSRRSDAKEIRDWLAATKERYAAWAARL